MTLWQLTLWAFTNEQGGFFRKIGKFFKKVAKPVLAVGGGLLGGLLGGPVGAGIGAKLGGGLGGALVGGGAAAAGVFAGREQARRLAGIRELQQPFGGAPTAPLFQSAADIARNQAIAAGFGRSGAQALFTGQALNRLVLADLAQRRQLAGAALGVPGAVQTGLRAGGGVLEQLGGLLGGGAREGEARRGGRRLVRTIFGAERVPALGPEDFGGLGAGGAGPGGFAF